MSLSINPHHKLQVINVSGNRFSAKSAETFARALQDLPNAIPYLDVSDTGLTSPAFLSFLSAFTVNWGSSLPLQDLNLSNNQLAAGRSSRKKS